MFVRLALSALLLAGTPALMLAQAAPDHVSRGDRSHAARDATAALAHYEAALTAAPTNYDALWKASRAAIDIGEYLPDRSQRSALYSRAESYARRAVETNPADAEGHFALARALGRSALTMGTRDRIRFAEEVRAHALEALRRDPTHAGALHVMGVWNAEVMRLNGVERFVAKNLLGGQVFGEASWEDAIRYLERAVTLEPNRITHRLDLARVYADMDNRARAREQLTRIATTAAVDVNDAHYKREAAALLQRLK